MELLYTYIYNYRNFEKIGFNFGNRFHISYSYESSELLIEQNTSFISIYPDFITNISAIVGKNSAGKTNIVDLIGMKIEDRNYNNAEREILYPNKDKKFTVINHDAMQERKKYIYFFIYYLGKTNNNEDLFCIEGNDIDIVSSLVLDQSNGLNFDYWREKYWYAFSFTYKDKKIQHEYDMHARLGKFTYTIQDDGSIVYSGDYLSERDKLAIISFREHLNSKYYYNRSVEPIDDYRISIPRRVAVYNPNLIEYKLRTLHDLLQKNNRQLFNDSKYEVVITYDDSYLNYNFKEVCADAQVKGKLKLKLIESFIKYLYHSLYINDERLTIEEHLKNMFDNWSIGNEHRIFETYINFYREVFIIIVNNSSLKPNLKLELLEKYDSFVTLIIQNTLIKLDFDSLVLTVTKSTNINELIQITNQLIDEKYQQKYNEKASFFQDFFSYSLHNLSDGENAYLGLFSSIWEQVNLLVERKKKCIIILDEPEVRMHPELSRTFIYNLINFLQNYNNKRYQIIISTHSPFILTDLPSSNILFLSNINGIVKVQNNATLTFGANIHELLQDGFFMNSTIGEYAKQKVNAIIQHFYVGNSISKDEVKYLISIIGEKIIKAKLSTIYYEKYSQENDLKKTNKKGTSIIKSDEKTNTKAKLRDLRNKINELLSEIEELESEE